MLHRAQSRREHGLLSNRLNLARFAIAQGAGKTETVKIMMNYLAEAAGKKKADGGAAAAAAAGGGVGGFSDVASAVISSNPLLEAFGNAR